LTAAEKERKERIISIQGLLNQGYSASYIKKLFDTTYNSIRKYKTGDPDLLCRFPEKPGVSGLIDPYREFILDCLNRKMNFAAILREIHKTKTSVKRTAFNVYCRKLKAEYGINNKTNTIGRELVDAAANKTRYIKRKDILRYLWTGKGLSGDDYAIACEKYGALHYLECFIFDFKSILMRRTK